MTRNGKMASEGTFEPCEKGTNDPVVQRSLCIFFNVSSLNMPSFKISKSEKGLFYQRGFEGCDGASHYSAKSFHR